MAVSSMISAMQSIFATPTYANRIPENVRTAIANGNFGTEDFTTNEKNAVMDALVDKISRQNIYSFRYAGFDGEKYNKGYMASGGIIEDDYVDVADADVQEPLPVASEYTPDTDWADVAVKYDPFKIKYAKVKTAYYMNKYYLQYHVTTTQEFFKRAFISEGGAVDFISRIRGVLPESGKLDKYLLFKNMISVDASGKTIFKQKVPITVAGSTFTAQESIQAVKTIRNYVSALKYPTIKYNALGVLTTSTAENLVLFMSEGIYNEISAAQYNAYHKDLDFGCKVQPIDGFGENALTSGQFAALVDERAIKLYTWLRDTMDNIYNPTAGGYWNTYYKTGGLIGYGLWGNAIMFNLSDGQ